VSQASLPNQKVVKLVQRIKTALTNPLSALYHVRGRLSSRSLFERYGELARNSGVEHVQLLLSFDCDTEDDIATVWDVHSRLRDLGVNPVYAVPGELLQQGEAVYRRVLEAGGEFLNHGFTQHTFFDEEKGRHASCFFYDQLERETVREDIVRGDECLQKVLGVKARGFRTPHFGSFQKPEQLRFMHGVLKSLDYQFSTSTSPLYGFRYGPVFTKFGVRELPVTGMASVPLRILDTWSCFEAPNRSLTPDDYYAEGAAIADVYANLGAGLLNCYADPSHIHENDVFFETVKKWLSIAESVNFGTFIQGNPCKNK
jgi:hypothetical protein